MVLLLKNFIVDQFEIENGRMLVFFFFFKKKKNLVENLKLSFFEIIFIQGCLWTCAFSLYIFDSHCKVLLKPGSQEKFPQEKNHWKIALPDNRYRLRESYLLSTTTKER